MCVSSDRTDYALYCIRNEKEPFFCANVQKRNRMDLFNFFHVNVTLTCNSYISLSVKAIGENKDI